MNLVAAALADGPLCAHDLAPKVFLCYGHAWRLVKGMHELGMVHIAKWPLRRMPRATRVAAYALGAGKDAPKPKRLTQAQRQTRYKSKLRADADRLDIQLSKDRARKLKPTRDPLVAAMYGSAAARNIQGANHA
jgi:hypothetical protein